MANMYQDLGRNDLALKLNLEALNVTQYFFGSEENLQTASMYATPLLFPVAV